MKSVLKGGVKFLLYQLAIFSILGMQAKTINFQKPANDNRDFVIWFRKYTSGTINQYNAVFKQSDAIIRQSGSFSLPPQITLHDTTANPNLPNETVKTDDQNLTIVISHGSYKLFEKLLSQLSDGTTIAITAITIPPPPPPYPKITAITIPPPCPEGTKKIGQDRCWSIK